MHAPSYRAWRAPRGALLTQHPLIAYGVLAYAITWLLVLPLVLSAQGVFATPVARQWHVVGALGPIGAALLVTALVGGRRGLAALVGRIGRWRVGVPWLVLALGSPLVLFALAVVGLRLLGAPWPDWSALARYGPFWLAGELLSAVAYGIGEETGWRGFALPRLQRKHSALIATCILTVVHALWHLPMFWYRFAFSPVMVVGFFVGMLAGAIWLTSLYNSTGGSILMVAAWHTVWNIVNQIGAVVAPDTSALMSVLLMIGALAIVVVWRPAQLSPRPRHTLDEQ